MKRISTLLLIAFFGFCVTKINAQESSPDKIRLSDLNLKKVEQAWWTAQKDKAIDGKFIVIGKQGYRNGNRGDGYGIYLVCD